VGLELDFLQVQDDVGHVLDHAVNGGEFVHGAIHLDGGDGRAFERGEQHAAQRVADGVAVTGFKRVGDEFGVGFRGGLLPSVNRLGISKRPRRTGIFSFQQF
jgi:hypothetical protein